MPDLDYMPRFDTDLQLGTNIKFHREYAEQAAQSVSSNIALACITSARGPVNQAIAVTNFDEFTQIFGGYQEGTTGYTFAHQLFNYYAIPGAIQPMVYFVRVVGPSATNASATCVDTNDVATIKIEALGPSEDDNNISYQWLNGDTTIAVDDPTTAPTITSGTGSIIAGTYELKYAYVNGNGSTLASTGVGSITTSEAKKLILTTPDTALPYGVDHIVAYIKVGSTYRTAATGASGSRSVDITALPGEGASQLPASNTAGVIPTRKLKVWYKGELLPTGEIGDIRLNDSDIDEINARLPLVQLTNLDSASVIPLNLPKVMAEPAYLTGGDSDLSNITDATYVGEDDPITGKTGLKVFDDDRFENATMCCPNMSTEELIGEELERQGVLYKRMFLIEMESTTTYDDIGDYFDDRYINTEFAMVYFPSWGYIENPDRNVTGSKRRILTSITADLLGNMYYAMVMYGPYRPPAGYDFFVRSLAPPDPSRGLPGGLVRDTWGNPILDNTKATELDRTYRIMPVREIEGVGTVFYSCPTFTSNNSIYDYPNAKMEQILTWKLMKTFRTPNLYMSTINYTNQGKVLGHAYDLAYECCKEVFYAGGLTGDDGTRITGNPNDAFRVVCDETNNPIDRMRLGHLRIDVFVHGVLFVKYIDIHIFPVASGRPLV